jgi:multidrug resistance efflux pump
MVTLLALWTVFVDRIMITRKAYAELDSVPVTFRVVGRLVEQRAISLFYMSVT